MWMRVTFVLQFNSWSRPRGVMVEELSSMMRCELYSVMDEPSYCDRGIIYRYLEERFVGSQGD